MALGVVRGWRCVVGGGGIVQLLVERREYVSDSLSSGVIGTVVADHFSDERSFPSRLYGADALKVFVLLEDGAYLLSSFGTLLLPNVLLYCFADRPSSVRVCGWDVSALPHEAGNGVVEVVRNVVFACAVRIEGLCSPGKRAVQRGVFETLFDFCVKVVKVSWQELGV